MGDDDQSGTALEDEGSALWRAEEAAAACGGRLDGRAEWTAGGVDIDSRSLRPGDLFVALPGDGRDGHDFIAAAFDKGAAAALATHRPQGLDPSAPLLIVTAAQRGLERLGAAGRRRARAMGAVAVTGSVGKTSTKEMLATILSRVGPTHAAEKSFNNHIGVPLSLARTAPEAHFGVYEVGMSAPGEIAPLARLVAPDVALITAVEAAHLEAFESIDGIADEKASIFEGLRENGLAIAFADGPTAARVARRARDLGVGAFWSFGAAGIEARLLSTRLEPDHTLVEAEILGQRLSFTIGAPGAHFAMNALGALLAAARLGADLEAAAQALARWGAGAGRGAKERLTALCGGDTLLLDESYNANPASLKAALAVFAAQPARRRVAFLTDMLELGPTAPALHAAIAETAEIEAVDVVHTAGPLAKALYDALPPERRGEHFETAEALEARAPALLRDGDAVLVKGSNGSKAHAIAAALRTFGAPAAKNGA
ncbi:MAG: UDP-N-acetylmuramoyl-tripeptide--D-alanyl-D-alanine ligase [Pseudomonadota bacterium]